MTITPRALAAVLAIAIAGLPLVGCSRPASGAGDASSDSGGGIQIKGERMKKKDLGSERLKKRLWRMLLSRT